ncbi:hypothetical protein Droror1_Dr00028335 [Drosera rotundifolia]
MAAATGFGAVPFFCGAGSSVAGLCNGMAAGVMLAASFDLIQEGDHGHGNWVVFGILSGGIFIWLCEGQMMFRGFSFIAFGVGPLLGGIILVAFALAFNLQHSLLTVSGLTLQSLLSVHLLLPSMPWPRVLLWELLFQKHMGLVRVSYSPVALHGLTRSAAAQASCISEATDSWQGPWWPPCGDGIRESYICYWSDYHGNQLQWIGPFDGHWQVRRTDPNPQKHSEENLEAGQAEKWLGCTL